MLRTGRFLFLPLVCATLSLAGDPPEPALRLATASHAPEAPPADAAVVQLTKDGEIRVDRKGRAEMVSLDQLAEWLRERKERFEAAAREGGDAAPPGAPGHAGASRLPVVLRIDRDAPWQHAQWILGVCAQEGLARTELAVEGPGGAERALAAHLPTDAGLGGRSIVTINVSILVKNEELATWGPAQTRILKPTEIAYKMLDREAPEIEAVRRFIRDAHQAASAVAGITIVGEIDAEKRLAFAEVVAVLDEFHRAGLTDVRFRATEPPSSRQRREPRLSYPAK